MIIEYYSGEHIEKLCTQLVNNTLGSHEQKETLRDNLILIFNRFGKEYVKSSQLRAEMESYAHYVMDKRK